MATIPLGAESAPANPLNIFATFDRSTIASAVEVLVAVLDTMDGDTDAELNGDEADGSMAEDDFHQQSENWLGHPGCPIADPGGCEHDGREEDHDAERETWAHWMDHPAELHIGKRPGHTN